MLASWLLVVHVNLQIVEDWSHRTGKYESDSGRREERVRRVRELQNLRRPSVNCSFISAPTASSLLCATKTFAHIVVKSLTMVATQFLLASFIAAASATNLIAREDAYFASLLKRQEPGTPAYNCHDNW
jgi:hypothetical protein